MGRCEDSKCPVTKGLCIFKKKNSKPLQKYRFVREYNFEQHYHSLKRSESETDMSDMAAAQSMRGSRPAAEGRLYWSEGGPPPGVHDVSLQQTWSGGGGEIMARGSRLLAAHSRPMNFQLPPPQPPPPPLGDEFGLGLFGPLSASRVAADPLAMLEAAPRPLHIMREGQGPRGSLAEELRQFGVFGRAGSFDDLAARHDTRDRDLMSSTGRWMRAMQLMLRRPATMFRFGLRG